MLAEIKTKLLKDYEQSFKIGVVEVGGVREEVLYRFVSEDTIECWNSDKTEFLTHYKSLIKETLC